MRLATSLRDFRPDLVVEVTMLCDRKCPGCYAPTVLVRHNKSPSTAFLSPEALGNAMDQVASGGSPMPIPVVAVRGGEPSLNPDLVSLLAILHGYGRRVYLETNGHWILRDAGRLLRELQRIEVVVKVSYDSMHSLRATELRQVCKILDEHEVEWVVAITERTVGQYHRTWRRCPWVPLARTIYQPFVSQAADLSSPPLGVIHPNGRISRRLSSRSLPWATLAYAGQTSP